MVQSSTVLGYDIGSSSVKATILAADTGRVIASAGAPATEAPISAPHPGWAEQDPDSWWGYMRDATARLRESDPGALEAVAAVGISYQMHGLVIVDKALRPLRPCILWCDSRAVEIGNRAFREIGPDICLDHCCNSPGNFTASKLHWVRQHEPALYKRVHKMMLPGDYIILKLTGELSTTWGGLSEAVLWDFRNRAPCTQVLEHFGIDPALLAQPGPSLGEQGKVTRAAAEALGVPEGAVVSYRAGDQPNNAFSLNVLDPGEVAATAGTSGVIYGVCDTPRYDPASRVNTFVHVNDTAQTHRNGMLLCVNGGGILNSWLKANTGSDRYPEMNTLAATVPPGSDGLTILPYGNGAERTLGNTDPGAQVHGLCFTRHSRAHLLRAAQEGIVCALTYGLDIMRETGLTVERIRAGHANLFLSPLFREAFAATTGVPLELYDTDGAQGAARGAALGAGIFRDPTEAFAGLTPIAPIEPSAELREIYARVFARWRSVLSSSVRGA